MTHRSTGDQDTILLNCRAQISDACEGGLRRSGWREDGTYRRSSDSVVCTPCYILAGAGPNETLDAAIRAVRKIQAGRQPGVPGHDGRNYLANLAAEVLRHGPPIDPTP